MPSEPLVPGPLLPELPVASFISQYNTNQCAASELTQYYSNVLGSYLVTSGRTIATSMVETGTNKYYFIKIEGNQFKMSRDFGNYGSVQGDPHPIIIPVCNIEQITVPSRYLLTFSTYFRFYNNNNNKYYNIWMDNAMYPSQYAAELQHHIDQLTTLANAIITAKANECQ